MLTDCSKFMEVFREETNWVMPFLHVLFVDTRLLAARVRACVHELEERGVHGESDVFVYLFVVDGSRSLEEGWRRDP